MKAKRHLKILEIIGNDEIETQEELSSKLRQEGYPVTQATISRDIRELRLTKVSNSSGGQKYIALENDLDEMNEKYEKIFTNAFVSMDVAENILVLHTVGGMAMAVAAALDSWGKTEILGSTAGDDTIISVARSHEDAVKVMEYLRRLLKKSNKEN